ncbi:hypothetical protein [Paenibacillus aceris]|uniref:DUF4367 domain-containing protein n=1 Tax=Paenibacillus aceris TaxID=869555 RepID=A0ABS4I1S5_9BACL|nr:hypothetical protein [Paenibacillus aceris]MBP1964371.1 hypothetical protein [Paenibacillus aceris]NHW35913.1 hypothetical protein [Paenibacillus aceris]
MLSLEEKLAIVESFPELQRKDVSLGRINFHYEESSYDKKIVVYHLHPNGNGFVYADYVKGYATDSKGFINIRDFNGDELRTIIQKSILSLTDPSSKAQPKMDSPKEERWTDEDGHVLSVTFSEDLWYVYAGSNLDCAFETYEEVEEYMSEEGFAKQ